MRSWARTTLPFRQARCSAVRPSPSPQVSFTSSREPCASSKMTIRRSSSAVARSRCWPRDSSVHDSGARKSFCSYLARIHRSFSSLQESPDRRGHDCVGEPRLHPSAQRPPCGAWSGGVQGAVTSVFTRHQEAPLRGKAPLQCTKWVPTRSTSWAPVRDAGSQAPSQSPESEPLGCVLTSPAGDSDALRCENQGSALSSHGSSCAFCGPRRITLLPGVPPNAGWMPQARRPDPLQAATVRARITDHVAGVQGAGWPAGSPTWCDLEGLVLNLIGRGAGVCELGGLIYTPVEENVATDHI